MKRGKIWLLTLLFVFLVSLVGCKLKEPEKIMSENIEKIQYMDILGYQKIYNKQFEYLTIEKMKDGWYLIKFFVRNKIIDYIFTEKYYLTKKELRKNAKIYTNYNVVAWRHRLHFSYSDFF